MKKLTLLLCFMLFSIYNIFAQQPDLVVIPDDFDILTKSVGSIYHTQSFVHNNGDIDANPSMLKYYLSSDNVFSSSDILLGEDYVRSITAGGIPSEEGAYLEIPSVSGGTYYILYFADADNSISESNESNNVTAVQVEIIAPDLIALDASVGTSTINPGQSKNISYKIKNIGNASSGSSSAKFYLSTNSSFSSDDVIIGSRNTSALEINQTETVNNFSLTIPSSTSEGNYFILVKADGNNNIAESYENNNIDSSSSSFFVDVVVIGKPDLAFSYTDLSSSDGTIFTGGERLPRLSNNSSINLNIQTTNNGNENAGQFYVELFVSRNSSSYDPASDFVDQHFVNTLNINETDFWNSPYIYVNQHTHIFSSSGNYYFHFVIDRTDDIDESNSSNNVSVIKTYYSNTGNRPGPILKSLDTNSQIRKPYDLYIYNYYGKLINKVIVKNEAGENEVLKNLPQALYILKSNNGSRKVFNKK